MKSTQRHKRNGNNRRASYKYYARILRKHKNELYERYKVKEISIFGSYARGSQRKKSDLDILVSYEVVPDLLSFINLENYLSKILKKKVDLVRKEYIPEEVRDRILDEAVIA